eukprot:TRINITY_DN41407_c0_g1_i1.p1 TRINITY_DN41407_c0_g1~~TRINITY_DN41407_c0_g1_i1.p1  ORF type:complete len:501 (-),score=79.22 TRINITY_DN41407_c0_g1_i1:495-1997(-)
MGSVYLLVVKGNLKHRLDLLGIEKPDDQIDDKQKLLRRIAEEMGLGGDNPARPARANGACVYLTPEHAKEIWEAAEENDALLQSKHILVSDVYKSLVQEVLDAKPDGSGREVYLKRRAGVIEYEFLWQMERFSFEELHNKRNGIAPPSTATSADGTKVNAGKCEEPEGKAGYSSVPSPQKNPDEIQPSGESDKRASEDSEGAGRPQKTKMHLLQLDPDDLQHDKDIDLDLLEFCTAPPSVQKLQPEMWLDVWDHVHEENEWLGKKGEYPYCNLCEAYADLSHLLSEGCEENVRQNEKEVGPLLKAILLAEKRQREGTLTKKKDPSAKSTAKSDAGLACGEPQKCQKPGCPFPAGGKNSPTHCCKRCQLADEKGVDQLYTDPRTGNPWRQPHGPECTSKSLSTPPQRLDVWRMHMYSQQHQNQQQHHQQQQQRQMYSYAGYGHANYAHTGSSSYTDTSWNGADWWGSSGSWNGTAEGVAGYSSQSYWYDESRDQEQFNHMD